jgi:hypothetical protein
MRLQPTQHLRQFPSRAATSDSLPPRHPPQSPPCGIADQERQALGESLAIARGVRTLHDSVPISRSPPRSVVTTGNPAKRASTKATPKGYLSRWERRQSLHDLVKLAELLRRVRQFAHPNPSMPSEFGSQIRIEDEFPHRLAQFPRISDRNKPPTSVVDHFRSAADVRRDDR